MALGDNAIRRLTVIATDQGLTALNTKMRENDRLAGQITASHTRMATATAAADQRMQALLRQRDRLSTAFAGAGGATGLAGSAIGAAAPYAVAGAGIIATIAAMNAVWQRGSELLEKYGNAQKRFDREDFQTNLASLTKFQNDKETAAQAQYATELAVRLQDANFQIEKFLKTSFDLTDPALALKSVWVGIVETVAGGVGWLDQMIAKMNSSEFQKFFAARNGVPDVTGDSRFIGPEQAPNYQSPDQLMRAARGTLANALDVSYIGREGAPAPVTVTGRFNQSIYDMKNPPKPEEEAEASRTAWDRAIETARKHVAVQEAEVRAVGAGVGAQAQYRMEAQLLEAGLRTGMTPELVKATKEFQDLTEGARAAAVALGEKNLRDNLGFERSQIGRSDTEQKVASQLRGIYGNDYVNQMDSAIAAQIRFNETLRTSKDLATDFATGITRDVVSGLRAGESAWEAFAKAGQNALNRLADKLIDMAVQNLVTKAFGGIANSGFFGVGVQGFPTVDAANQAAAAFPVPIAHSGGVIGHDSFPQRYIHPAYFENARRYHSGGIAGLKPDEVPAILQRGERVVPNGGGGAPIINNISVKADGAASAQVTQSRRNGSGGVDLEVMVTGIVNRGMGQGDFDAALGSRTGGRPAQVRR